MTFVLYATIYDTKLIDSRINRENGEDLLLHFDTKSYNIVAIENFDFNIFQNILNFGIFAFFCKIITIQ